ncbi:MAG TPA: helix-turn-helix domain-containing protein [Pseudonocardiaceae bacterium]|jgi:AcrR family transcriptional regulator|nr:helix-turn-helix domain-containing protein [Pseudonocardiaceae bacterium]
MTAVSDLLAARRPHRADAARNFDAILAAGRAVFTEKGAEGALEDVARRAGVGIATLYRNFPTRESLIEAVYVAEVDQVCQYADELTGLAPGDAFNAWLERFAVYLNTKRALVEGLSRESVEGFQQDEAYQTSRSAIYATGGPLLERAQAAGTARGDVDIDDVMRFILGVTAGIYRDEDQRSRIVRMAIRSVDAG